MLSQLKHLTGLADTIRYIHNFPPSCLVEGLVPGVDPGVDPRAQPMDLSLAPKPVSFSQNVLSSRQTAWDSKTGELVAIITKRNSIRAERSDSMAIVRLGGQLCARIANERCVFR
jgi:hypothetical protein